MRMSSGLTGNRLSSPFGERTSYVLKDKTAELLRIGFPELTEDVVKWRHNTITGMPECGKSITLDDRAYHAINFYARFQERVNIIRTDSLEVAYNMIDENYVVQYAQVDDAATLQSSLAPYELKDMIATFQKLRHVLEDVVKTFTGVMIVDLAWQREKEVFPTFRNGVTRIFKSGMAEPDDDNYIHRLIGDNAHAELNRIWNRMVEGDQEIKSTSIGYLPSQRGQRNAAGYYHTTYRKDWSGRPKMVYASDYFNDAVAIESVLDKLRSRGAEWDFKVDCYTLTEIDGMLTTDAAEELGKSQGWISRCVKSVKAELSRQGVA